MVLKYPPLFLCEGRNDYKFIQRVLNEKVISCDRNHKDKIIRLYYTQDEVLPIRVIIEGGKKILISNLNILLSKLRSINFNFAVISVIDSDFSKPEEVINSIYENFTSILKNPRRFPSQRNIPSIVLNKNGNNWFTIKVDYRKGYQALFEVIIIEPSLDHWLEKDLCQLEKSSSNWLKDMIKLFNYYKLPKKDLCNETVTNTTN